MVPADLSSPNWTDRLTAAGFDPSLRTVWVAEGLLMYLPEHAVSQLLSACRAASPAGSVFLINTVTRVFRRSKELSDLGTEGLGADDIARIRPGSAAEAGVSGDGGGEATADVGPKGRGGADGGGAVGTPQGRSGRARGSLMDEWQWVCDPDPTEYLRERGWETVARVWRGHPEMSYGRVPEEEQSRVFPESRPGARFGNSLFIRAVTA